MRVWIRFVDGEQDHYPLWENIYVVEADSHDSANAAAVELGRAACEASECVWEGRPAMMEFAGVRKTVQCEMRFPESGAEMTYSEMTATSKDALDKLIHGEPVEVVIED